MITAVTRSGCRRLAALARPATQGDHGIVFHNFSQHLVSATLICSGGYRSAAAASAPGGGIVSEPPGPVGRPGAEMDQVGHRLGKYRLTDGFAA